MSMASFWHRLPRPISVLAPMEDVTDVVFRDVVDRAGRPQVFVSEFVATRAMKSRQREALRRLEYKENHRPMVAQIWGTDPQYYYDAAIELHRRGFDGIDINMGCPQKKITSKGPCSALILNPPLAAELIAAAREGAEQAYARFGDQHEGPPGRLQSGGALPVSVKTRIGFSAVQTEDWCGFLLQQELPLLTVHGRTAAQQSEGEADWDEIARVVALRDRISPDTLIFGNGDVVHPDQLTEYPRRYGVDGVMVGRGIFSNPFIFAGGEFHDLPARDQVRWASQHLQAYRKAYEGRRNFEVMKKFFKIYIMHFEGADNLRDSLMQTHDYDAALELLTGWQPPVVE